MPGSIAKDGLATEILPLAGIAQGLARGRRMTEGEFDFLRALLKSRSGLALGAEKRYLVESRLGPVCQRHGVASLSELAARLKGPRHPVLERDVVEAMTTNETFFSRDRTPFDLFRDVLLPRCLASLSGSRRIRIWCAASLVRAGALFHRHAAAGSRREACRLAGRDRRDGPLDGGARKGEGGPLQP